MSRNSLKVKIVEIGHETPDVKALTLASTEGHTLPTYAPGAHIDVITPSGLVRQYSLCTLYGDGKSYRIAVKLARDSRGGSRDIHERLALNDTLLISPPRNNFSLVTGAHHMLIAGGIGITPLFAMMQQLEADGQSYELHYFAQHESLVCFRNIIMRADIAIKTKLYLGVAPENMPANLERIIGSPQEGRHIYFCGPGPMVQLIEKAATALQWPQDALHKEYFSPTDQNVKVSDFPFSVTLNSTGQKFDIPAEKSILQVLRENGISPLSSCEQGTCGTCICKVLDGDPDHRDHFLSDFHKKSGKKIAICVSRSRSESLTIDL